MDVASHLFSQLIFIKSLYFLGSDKIPKYLRRMAFLPFALLQKYLITSPYTLQSVPDSPDSTGQSGAWLGQTGWERSCGKVGGRDGGRRGGVGAFWNGGSILEWCHCTQHKDTQDHHVLDHDSLGMA